MWGGGGWGGGGGGGGREPLKHARKDITEGTCMAFLTHRIKLADDSELAVGEEYDNSNNSDDKRRIHVQKAENAADWRRFQEGKQREGGATCRKNMARHISEPEL